MYEYTTEVFAVGLNGFAPVDNDRLNAMSAEGWEPAHMAPVHGGFAAVVLFRREAGAVPAGGAATRSRGATAARTRKVPPPTAPAAPSRAGRPSASAKASTKATRAPAASRSRTTRGR